MFLKKFTEISSGMYGLCLKIILCSALVHYAPSIFLPGGSHATGVKHASNVSKDLFNSYMKVLRDPPTGLDHIDCHDDEVISEYCNFDPERIMELLIQRAAAQKTPPEKFYTEIKQLITLRIKAANETDAAYHDWYQTLLSLEAKYNVASSGTDPDSITFSRLCFMFPQYSVVAKDHPFKILLADPTQFFDEHGKQIFYGDTVPVPGSFSPAEFAGVIPLGPTLNDTVREAIITVHLYVLFHQDKSIPFNTLQILVRRRIQSGLLSDEHRFRFLMNRGVITSKGELQLETKLTHIFILTEKDFISNLNANLTSFMQKKLE